MSVSISNTLTSLFNKSTLQRGWIGLECGHLALQLAQLERHGKNWQLASAWSLSLGNGAELAALDQPPTLDNAASDLMRLRGLFQGSALAATLGASRTSYREIELPRCSAEETRELICSEMAEELACDPGEINCEYWELTKMSRPKSEQATFAVIAVNRKQITSFAKQLGKLGFDCQILDGLPCAMARATQLMNSNQVEPIFALHLGASQGWLTLVIAGEPMFSRSLRSCRWGALVNDTAKEWQLNYAEAELLLQRYGLQSNANSANSGRLLQATGLTNYLHQVTVEVERTLHYLLQVNHRLVPQDMVLFGPGATLPGLVPALSKKLDLHLETWSMPHRLVNVQQEQLALYGIAAGLSSLAGGTC